MSAENTVTFYLHPKLRKQAERGNHNFIESVGDVLKSSGLEIAFDGDDDLARMRARSRPGRGLFLMDEPPNERSLTFRKTYIYPFWRIEQHAKRWEWPVAKELFNPDSKHARKAANFYRFWQNRLFEEKAQSVKQDGFVYVPLQGRLTTKRSFQLCSPIEMVAKVLEHDPKRYVMATLHPNEVYSHEEQQALERLIAQNERLYVRTGASERYLQNCDYIVTQNSSVGFLGYFFEKPLILFGKVDFHHISLNTWDMPISDAFQSVVAHRPDYAAYMHWFLQLRSINAGRSEAKTRIRTSLRNHGWPV